MKPAKIVKTSMENIYKNYMKTIPHFPKFIWKIMKTSKFLGDFEPCLMTPEAHWDDFPTQHDPQSSSRCRFPRPSWHLRWSRHSRRNRQVGWPPRVCILPTCDHVAVSAAESDVCWSNPWASSINVQIYHNPSKTQQKWCFLSIILQRQKSGYFPALSLHEVQSHGWPVLFQSKPIP